MRIQAEWNFRKGQRMKLLRRQFLRLAASTGALPIAARFAWAQSYPTKPVRVIVGFPAGGPADIMARLMGQWLSARLGQTIIIENRPGANTNIATETVVRSPPDGYTLLLTSSAGPISAAIYNRLNFDFNRDITPVASISRVPLVLEVNPSLPAKTVPEFIAYAKANPGRINMASAGKVTATYVAGELFKMMAGIDMLHVPYLGSAPALTDLISGRVQVMFDTISSSIEHIRANKLRALAVTTTTRSKALPDIPIVAEFLPGFEASFWCGIGLPRNAPTEIVDKLNKEINAGLADARMKARFARLGAMILVGSPSDFGKFVADEMQKWAKVVNLAGIKPN
jgi:tripartite-type tricarboxylate transporter receptor subunit TctC